MNDYWTEERLQIWRNMEPWRRDMDRYLGSYPPGQGGYETREGRIAATSIFDRPETPTCSCHINPPCSYCTEATE